LLLVAAYWHTGLTLRQVGWLFRVSYMAAYRVIDTLSPLPDTIRAKATLFDLDGG
jgi:hypothetical protein